MVAMGKYDFDKIIDRRNTDCIKWDFGMQRKGRDDLLPLWVADMDFRLPEEVIKDISDRVLHGVFGYTDPGDKYRNTVKEWYERRHGFTFDGKEVISLSPTTISPFSISPIKLILSSEKGITLPFKFNIKLSL